MKQKNLKFYVHSFGLNGPAYYVKRAICEMAEAPLSGNGLFGQLSSYSWRDLPF